jgi:hypothetical protein
MQTPSALNKTTQLFALVFTGFLAGSFYYGTLILVPAFYDVPSTVHLVYRVHLMDHNAIFMQLINALAAGGNIVRHNTCCYPVRQCARQSPDKDLGPCLPRCRLACNIAPLGYF